MYKNNTWNNKLELSSATPIYLNILEGKLQMVMKIETKKLIHFKLTIPTQIFI